MHGQVNVQRLGRSIHGSVISVQEAYSLYDYNGGKLLQ